MPLQEFLVLALRTLLLLVVPLLLIVAIAGTLVSALQSVTTVHDPATSYVVRLLALVLALYLFFPLFSQSFLTLVTAALR